MGIARSQGKVNQWEKRVREGVDGELDTRKRAKIDRQRQGEEEEVDWVEEAVHEEEGVHRRHRSTCSTHPLLPIFVTNILIYIRDQYTRPGAPRCGHPRTWKLTEHVQLL